MTTHTVIRSGETFLLCDKGLELFKSRKWCVFRNKRGHVYLKRGGEKNGSTVYFHRELLGLKAGDGVIADHISRDTRDNRLANLRKATPFINNSNRTLKRGGAFKSGTYWVSLISENGKRRYLGFFRDEQSARDAYQAAKNPGASL